jgi:type II secretory pathway pseudopilin PulG
MKTQRNISGVTIIELTVAITIAALVAAYVLGSYTNVMRMFKKQTTKSANIRTLILTKRSIEKTLGNVEEIVSISGGALKFKTSVDDSIHTIFQRNATLYMDNSSIGPKLGRINFLVFSGEDSTRKVLLWDAVCGNAQWVGGAQ